MKERILGGLATFFFIKFMYSSVIRPLLLPILNVPDFPTGIFWQALSFVLFSFTHAIYMLGWRHTLAFFGLSFVTSWTFEQVGVATGLIYGGYHYTDALGIKLGYVPVLTPLSWFMMLYPSYMLTNCMIGDHPVGSRGNLGRIIWVSFVSAMAMTSQDLIIDPIMSGPIIKGWVWEQGGDYFGVPIQNYLGWAITSFLIYVIYRLFEWRINPRPLGPITKTFTTMPLLAYGSLIITGTLNIAPGELKVIGPFALGLPVIIAITSVWFGPEQQTKSW